MEKPKLSIVIPAFNEEAFIGTLLGRIAEVPIESEGFRREVIVVDDGSRDRTAEVVSGLLPRMPDVRLIRQLNAGKGSAVQRGAREATGDYLLVQDADMEYDPGDYLGMLRALKQGEPLKTAVYGSRTLKQWKDRKGLQLCPGRHPRQGFGPWCAGVLLTLWTWLLYRRWITDTLTAYKIYPLNLIRSFQVKTKGFETDHELTAKLARQGIRIVEVPIAYHPRSVEEGKKIKASDGFIAVWTLLRFRF